MSDTPTGGGFGSGSGSDLGNSGGSGSTMGSGSSGSSGSGGGSNIGGTSGGGFGGSGSGSMGSGGPSMGSGGSSMSSGGSSMSSGGFGGGTGTGAGTGSGSEVCAHCGQSLNRSAGGGLEQFLGRLGITEEMIGNLKGQFQNVDIDEYLNTARDYLKDGSSKATTYAKDNPGKVAAGVAALALGAGLLYAAVNRDKT